MTQEFIKKKNGKNIARALIEEKKNAFKKGPGTPEKLSNDNNQQNGGILLDRQNAMGSNIGSEGLIHNQPQQQEKPVDSLPKNNHEINHNNNTTNIDGDNHNKSKENNGDIITIDF